MKTQNNLHGIEAIYYGATNCKGARVKLISHRFKEYLYIDYSGDNICNMAYNWLTSKGFNIVGQCETKRGYMLLTDTFEPIKKGL